MCKDVCKEPVLVNHTGQQEELRADVSARGVWQPMQRVFFYVKVFHPFAPSYRKQTLESTFRSMENQKKLKYNRKILQNEYGTFTPLIFSCNGGMSRDTSRFLSKEKLRKAKLVFG